MIMKLREEARTHGGCRASEKEKPRPGERIDLRLVYGRRKSVEMQCKQSRHQLDDKTDHRSSDNAFDGMYLITYLDCTDSIPEGTW
jgi:hypothetical protein